MRHTILVIDDQWSMQELARIVLQTAGYHVLFASDALTGLCLARTEQPDVTVLDANIMQQDGCDLLAHLRGDPRTAQMPLLLITTHAGGALLPLPTAPGFSNCLAKPFRPPELLVMVDRMLHPDDMPIAV